MPPFLVSAVNKRPSQGPCTASFLCFVWVTLLFKMAPKHGAEGLSGNPKCKKCVLCLTEKILVVKELRPSVIYSAVVHEFNANASAIYIK